MTIAPVPTKASGRRTLAERLERARAAADKAATRHAQKAARVKQYEAADKARKRKLDTRKKIIAGALALEHMQFDGRYGQAFRAIIDEYVTRDQERALFGLEPLPEGDQRRISPPRVY